ncbi:MAG: hypothetical protein SGARI_000764 [Bacillariaceae sp.]
MWPFEDPLRDLNIEPVDDAIGDLDEQSVASLTSTSAATQHIDSLLAKELYELSVDERNNVQEEVHGVRSLAGVETPQLLWNAMQQLKMELDVRVHNMDRSNDPGRRSFWADYSLAASQQFLKSERECLKYLRADRLDASKASQRMFTHLQLLHRYFGTML